MNAQAGSLRADGSVTAGCFHGIISISHGLTFAEPQEQNMPLALWYSGEKTQILCVFLIKTDSVMLAALVNAGDGIFHPFRNVYCVVAVSFKIFRLHQ